MKTSTYATDPPVACSLISGRLFSRLAILLSDACGCKNTVIEFLSPPLRGSGIGALRQRMPNIEQRFSNVEESQAMTALVWNLALEVPYSISFIL
jgi:hypothetical protein